MPFEPIPFVDGPRNCIGNRFALVEMKSLLIHLLKKYRVFATNKTAIPFETMNTATLNVIKDITLGFEPRTNINNNLI